MKHFAVLLLIVSVAGCTYFKGDSGRNKADELVDKAKSICTQLGYPQGSKEFVDCSTAQFNKLQESHYGPLH